MQQFIDEALADGGTEIQRWPTTFECASGALPDGVRCIAVASGAETCYGELASGHWAAPVLPTCQVDRYLADSVDDGWSEVTPWPASFPCAAAGSWDAL